MEIVLLGDSLVAQYEDSKRPLAGWGEFLKSELIDVDENLHINNLAVPGRSFYEFFYQDSQAIINRLQKNDIVIISFGHNDALHRNHIDVNDFENLYQQFLGKLLKAKTKPVVVTPPLPLEIFSELDFEKFYQILDIEKKVARKENLPCIELDRYTRLLKYKYQDMSSLYLQLSEGDSENYPEGIKDPVHFNIQGAKELSEFIAKMLKAQVLETDINENYFGSCMYPEVFGIDVFEKDIVRAKSLGMNFIRIGEFIWSDIEPIEGQYHFDLLEKSLQICQQYQMNVCLCVPTPTPPRWFTMKYPESCIVDERGKQTHGSRQHCCTNNPDFRNKCYQIAYQIGRLANQYTCVKFVQLDNEFKCHVDLCFCDECKKQWTEYLQKEFITIEKLNALFGTSIWSQTYRKFSEVVLPSATPFLHSVALMNSFKKFHASKINEFAKELSYIVRMNANCRITHNSSLGFNLDNEELFSFLDDSGFDTYASAQDYAAFQLNVDRWRNLKPNRSSALLLETSTSHAGHIQNYVQPHPKDYLSCELFSTMAGNLKAFNFWHFRGHRFGVEQPHSSVLTPSGEESLSYDEVVKTGKLFNYLLPIIEKTTYIPSKIGLIYSDDAKRKYTVETGGHYNYRSLITNFYKNLIDSGLNVEVISDKHSLHDFDVIFIPFVRNISSNLLDELDEFIQRNGKLIVGPMTGDRDELGNWHAENGLGDLGKLLGLSGINQEYFPNEQVFRDELMHTTERYAGYFTLIKNHSDWDSIIRFDEENSFVLRRNNTIFIGALPTDFSNSYLRRIIISEIAPIDSDDYHLTCSKGIVKYKRLKDGKDYIFLVNMSSEANSFILKNSMKELIHHTLYKNGEYYLAPYEKLILVEE